MRYFSRISPDFAKMLSKYPYSKANLGIPVYQNNAISFAFERHFMGFNLIYWNPNGGKYFLEGSHFEKYGKKTAVFSRQLRPDWGNTARAATAGLGSKGLNILNNLL